MSSKHLSLPIERRDRTGTTGSNALRAAGKIPAVLYGHGDAPQHVAIDAKAFDELLHKGGRTGIFTLTEGGTKVDTALVRELQQNPVTRKILHADLQRVSEHESVHSKLPIVAVGVARGVKELGGVMDIIIREIEVEGPIDEMPEKIEIDVTNLGIHEHISAGDVKLPKGFKLLTPADQNIVTIEASRTAQDIEDAAAPTLQPEPEVIGKTEATE